MVIGRWVSRVSLNICSDLEEVFSYPFRHTCLETKEKKKKKKNKKGGGSRGGGSRGKSGSNKGGVVEAKLVSLMDVLGLIRIRVRRGINLAVRDTLSSDPYCVVCCGTQKVKTKVVRGNCNPVWNEELTIYIKDFESPIVLVRSVWIYLSNGSGPTRPARLYASLADAMSKVGWAGLAVLTYL